MRSGNPVLNDQVFEQATVVNKDMAVMTIQGTVQKTQLCLLAVVGCASLTWTGVLPASPGLLILALIVASILGFVTVFNKQAAPVTTPIYCVAEGILLGAISVMYERQFPGIVMNAICLTFGTLFGLLLAYQSKLIKATENFKLGIAAATLGIGVLYFINFIMIFFGRSIPFIHESSPIGIVFSLVVVVIAALNLVMDFDFIERGAEQGAPKYMEWYGAFGLMVTLIWLYLEILRLLAKLRDRK